MSAFDHICAPDCASRNIDDLFRGRCDCYADDLCGDPDCSVCGDGALEDGEADSTTGDERG